MRLIQTRGPQLSSDLEFRLYLDLFRLNDSHDHHLHYVWDDDDDD